MAGDRPRLIMAHVFGQALVDAGILRADDLNDTFRIVIDAKAGEAVKLYFDRYGDERLLDVVRTLDGIEVRTPEASTP